MIKKILLPLFLLLIGIVLYLLVTETIERTTYFQKEIMRSDDYYPFRNTSLSRLAPEEISNLSLKYKIELVQLDYLKSISMALISLCGLLFIAIITFKSDFSVKKFDGIVFALAYILLVCAILAVFKMFINSQFEEGHNATIKIRTSIEIILLIISPLVFFTALKLNKIEIGKKLHTAKWITNFTIVLTVLSALIVLVVGIGYLSTPDVSTFTN
jgi:hypothetical protein